MKRISEEMFFVLFVYFNAKINIKVFVGFLFNQERPV